LDFRFVICEWKKNSVVLISRPRVVRRVLRGSVVKMVFDTFITTEERRTTEDALRQTQIRTLLRIPPDSKSAVANLNEMNYFNYYTEIEDAFVRRRGKHLF